MKYTLIAFAALLVSLTACKAEKDYICECTGGTISGATEIHVQATSHNGAVKACAPYNTGSAASGGIECRIK